MADPQAERLRATASRQGLGLSELLRRIIDAFLASEGRKATPEEEK